MHKLKKMWATMHASNQKKFWQVWSTRNQILEQCATFSTDEFAKPFNDNSFYSKNLLIYLIPLPMILRIICMTTIVMSVLFQKLKRL